MNPSSSKAHRESDPLEDETEDSPSTINLNDGDLRIIVEDNAKSISNSRPSRKHKSDIEQVEEWIDKIKSLSRSKKREPLA